MPKPDPTELPAEQPLMVRVPRAWHDDLRRRSYEGRTTIAELVRAALRAQYGYTDPPSE